MDKIEAMVLTKHGIKRGTSPGRLRRPSRRRRRGRAGRSGAGAEETAARPGGEIGGSPPEPSRPTSGG